MNTQSPTTEAANLMLDNMEFQDDEEYQQTRTTLAVIEEEARAEGRREAVDPKRIREALVAVDQEWDWGRDGHAAARARITDFAADISAALNASESPPTHTHKVNAGCFPSCPAHYSRIGDASESVQPPESHGDE